MPVQTAKKKPATPFLHFGLCKLAACLRRCGFPHLAQRRVVHRVGAGTASAALGTGWKMQARTLLALMAVAELLAICLNFTLAAYVIVLTLPFAMLALVGVFLAIYCGWRTGIWIFVGARAQRPASRVLYAR